MRPFVFILAALFSIAAFPVVSQEPKPPDPITVMGEPSAQSLSSFRKALIASAEQAVKDKELSRLDLFRLRVATMNKATLEKMHQACAEQVLADGKAASYGAIDWSKLITILKEVLPIILELIKLFADNATTYQSEFICFYPHSDCLVLAA